MKRLKLLLGLAVLIVVGAGVVFFSNTSPQTATPNSRPSFTYTMSDRTVTFYAEAGFANYAWNFRDSSSGTGATVSPIYDANGHYTVTLTAEPIAGASTPLSTFQQVIINTVTSVVHNYFVSLNVTLAIPLTNTENSATRISTYTFEPKASAQFNQGTFHAERV